MEIYSRVKNKLSLIFSIILLIGIISALSPLEQIQEFTSQGSTIINNFGFSEKGAAETGSIQFNDKEYEIGNIINDLFSPEDVTAKNIKLSKEEDSTTLTFNREDASVNIKDNTFTNILSEEKAGHPTYIKLDKNGEIASADLTTSDETSFNFNGIGYDLEKGSRIIYEKGEATIYKGGKNSLGLKKFDESGKEIEKTDIEILGDNIKIKRDSDNEILNGNFKIGEDEIKGGATLHNGEISKISKDTKATIDGITQQTSEDNVNIYHDANFNTLNHKGESYLNYGKNSIFMGGKGFKIDLGNKNNIFGDMKNKKYIQGQKEPKKRDLKITLNNGEIELSKNPESSDLAFNVNGKGDYVIDNGRAVIYSDNLDNPEENKIFVKTNIKDGLTDSYDLNLNNKYKLTDNLFKDKKGNIIVNVKTPWENIIYKTNNLAPNIIEESKNKITKETGVRPRNYLGYINKEDEEDMLKWTYEAADTANKNKEGVKISPEELYVMMMAEGGAAEGDGYLYPDYKKYGHETKVSGSSLGLDQIGEHKKELEKEDYVPSGFFENLKKENTALNEHGQEMYTFEFKDPKQALVGFAGELARRKNTFENDFKKAFGEEEFKKLSKEEEYYWVRRYFNTGEGAGKGELTGTKYTTYNWKGEKIVVQGKGRKNLYKPWKGNEPSYQGNPQFNAMVALSTYKYLKDLGLFSYP